PGSTILPDWVMAGLGRRGIMKRIRFEMAVSSLAGIDESALVTQARDGDTTAFGELVRRYEGKIFRLAQHVTQNREDAEDVLQETFVKAYEKLDQFKGGSKFYTFIVRIAVRQALMKLRRRKTDKSVSLDETIDTGEDTVTREIAAWDENPEQQFSRDELGGILDTAIQSLEPPYRSVFVLRDIDELSTEETAEALGLSVPAVKSRLLRARLQLREKLTRFFKRKGDDAFAYMCGLSPRAPALPRRASDFPGEAVDAQVRAKLEQHITECPNCWVIADTTKKTIRIYKGMEPHPIPAEVESRLMKALEKKMATREK